MLNVFTQLKSFLHLFSIRHNSVGVQILLRTEDILGAYGRYTHGLQQSFKIVAGWHHREPKLMKCTVCLMLLLIQCLGSLCFNASRDCRLGSREPCKLSWSGRGRDLLLHSPLIPLRPSLACQASKKGGLYERAPDSSPPHRFALSNLKLTLL